ncbi:MAG: hypothetical protein MUC50_02230, partial [Myxococcota bacterium]|nr:hypothetical protein [Myxococcota bacterium]
MNQIWPADSADSHPARLKALVRVWPQQAAVELAALTLERDVPRERYGSVLCLFALTAGDEAWSSFSNIAGEEWALQGSAVRAALRAVSDAEDEAALQALSMIGLSSVYRPARLLISGLRACYRGEDDKALLALEPLGKDPVLGPVARALGLPCAVSTGKAALVSSWGALSNNEALCKRLSTPRQEEIVAFVRAADAMGSGKYNGAIAGLARVVSDSGSAFAEAVRRDAVGQVLADADDPGRLLNRYMSSLPRPRDPFEIIMTTNAVADATLRSGAVHIAEQHEIADLWLTQGIMAMDGYRTLGDKKKARVAAFSLHRSVSLGRNSLSSTAWLKERVDAFRIILSTQPADVRLLLKKAQGSEDSNVFCLRSAVEFDPNHLPYRRDLAELLETLKRKNEALAVVEAALVDFPDNVELLELAAKKARKRQSLSKALKYVERAISLEPMRRELRRQQVVLMCAGAAKTTGAKAREKTVGILEEAARLPGLDAAARCLPVTLLLTRLATEGKKENLEVLRRRGLDAGCNPWALSLCEKIWCSRAEVSSSRGKRKSEGPLLEGWRPTEAASDSDLREMESLLSFLGTEAFFVGKVPRSAQELLGTALSQAFSSVNDKELLERISKDALGDSKCRLGVGERGCSLDPKSPYFIHMR